MSRANANRMNRRALALYAAMGRIPRCVEYRDWGDLSRRLPGENREYEPCGTEAAHKRHLRRGETPCDACKAWNAAAKRKGTGALRGRYAA